MSLLLRDLRHAWRLLRRQPAFAAVAILTLALGIGSTTAVFTVVNGVLLRPLPYRDPSRLVMLFYGHRGSVSPWLSPLNVRDYVGRSDAFAEASAVVPTTVNMTGLGEPERLQGAKVSWNYFRLLGVPMALGRPFAEGDAQGDGDQIVLADGLWRRRFGGRPDVVNSTTTFDGHQVTIVGVAPAALKFPAAAEFWQPLIFTPSDLAPADARRTVGAGSGPLEGHGVGRPGDKRAANGGRQPGRSNFPKQKRTRRRWPFRCTSGLSATSAPRW